MIRVALSTGDEFAFGMFCGVVLSAVVVAFAFALFALAERLRK